MRKLFAFLLFFIFFPLQIFADVWDSDNRYYVTDEMWAQEPYNKFVRLYTGNSPDGIGNIFIPTGICTGQYVAPNLILSAGHCVDATPGILYNVKNYKNQDFFVKLIESPRKQEDEPGINDWAIFLVTDKQYYSDTYFVPYKITRDTQVVNAGYGSLNILSEDSLAKIRQCIIDNKEEIKTTNSGRISFIERKLNEHLEPCFNNARELLDICEEKEKRKNILNMSKEELEDFSKCINNVKESREKCEKLAIRIKDEDRKLKASKCQILNKYSRISRLLEKDKYPYVLDDTCRTFSGNSGGGLVSNNGLIYAIVSYGVNVELSDRVDNRSASAHQFADRIGELKKIYPSGTSSGSIHNIPTTSFVGNTNNARLMSDYVELSDKIAPEQSETTASNIVSNATSINTNTDQHIEKIELEISDLDKFIGIKLSEIDNNTSYESLLSLLDNMAEQEYKKEQLEELQKAYEDAKAKEQSKENRILTALTVAATGIGGMELARGLAEQKADKEAEQDMAAYIATMRCTYGDNKQVKAGPDEIELPGANDTELMLLRDEYFALAKDLKERKEALGMKPGIESEEIIDKAQTGLYDDENLGVDSGAYASLYRAQMLSSEADQAKIDEEREASKNRVVAGGVLSGAGAVGGMVGDSLINGKLGEKIKENKNNKSNNSVIDKLKN